LSVDLLDNADDPDDLASAPADQDQTWYITQYLLPESVPDYDKRRALSHALEDWDFDTVSEPEALISTSFVLGTYFSGTPTHSRGSHYPSACRFTLGSTPTI
jgi:hypothetical protein